MKQYIECVPNFSEGRNMEIIGQITREIESINGVKLIGVEPGRAANRTVVTFAGTPDAVCEAAFNMVKIASELIDMRKHHGEHPRFGAIDVLPLIPLYGITMEETVELTRELGKRIGEELGIPIYCYEFAAFEEKRRNLASCRAGEYENLPQKLTDPQWKPDFGPASFTTKVAQTGAIALGARNILLAYNVNLNTKSAQIASEIAAEVREKGTPKRNGNMPHGDIIKDERGKTIFDPGLLKGVKGIGWYIEDYGIAQCSYNITDLEKTSIEQVFETTCERAEAHGIKVTGSELIGLIPLQAILNAGTYFLKKQHRSTDISMEEILQVAIDSLGLAELAPFNPKKKIIEFLIDKEKKSQLTDLSVKEYVEQTASPTPLPAGGSASATIAALGTALGTMVANILHKKNGDESSETKFSALSKKGKELITKLLKLCNDDSEAYRQLMNALALPQGTTHEKQLRLENLATTAKSATEIPLELMKTGVSALKMLILMAEDGPASTLADTATGAIALCAAVRSSAITIRANAPLFHDKELISSIINEAICIENKAIELEKQALAIVNRRLDEKGIITL